MVAAGQLEHAKDLAPRARLKLMQIADPANYAAFTAAMVTIGSDAFFSAWTTMM